MGGRRADNPLQGARPLRGIAYGRLGKAQEALDDFKAAIRLEPKEPVAYVNRENLYERANQLDKAIADFAHALELKPMAPTYAMRGTLHQKAKHYAKTREDDWAALKWNWNELTALNHSAWLQSTCPDADFRDGPSAVQHATMACQFAEWRVHGYVSMLAATSAKRGNFQKAVTLTEQIKETRVTDAGLTHLLGLPCCRSCGWTGRLSPTTPSRHWASSTGPAWLQPERQTAECRVVRSGRNCERRPRAY